MFAYLSLNPGSACVEQAEQVLEQGVLLSQIGPADTGTAEGQHHGQQLKAVHVLVTAGDMERNKTTYSYKIM